MKNQKHLNEECREDLKEGAISAEELIEEIKPLLDDYFNGDIISDGSAIIYVMPNGQKFKLTAIEWVA